MKSIQRISSIGLAFLMIVFMVLSPISVLAEEQVDLIKEIKETDLHNHDNKQISEDSEVTLPETSDKDKKSTEPELELEEEITEDQETDKSNKSNEDLTQTASDTKDEKIKSDTSTGSTKKDSKSSTEKVEAENEEEKQTINKNKEVKDYNALVQSAIDKTSAHMVEGNINSEWQAIGLVQAGKQVPSEYYDQFKTNIKDQITDGLENGRIKITDIERLAMAAVAIGKDPQDVQGHNLIELIYNSPDRHQVWNDTFEDTMIFQGNNGPIFALIALDTNNFHVPNDARWTRQGLIDELLRTQNEDGSWHLNESFDSPSIDITAMAIIGLSPYKNQPKVEKALDKTVTYLSEVQTDEAGFDGGSFVGGITSEAASQAIIGLTAYGIDPTSEHFTKDGINLIDHLLSYQHDGGGFKHTQGESGSNAMATEQALQGLVAYQFFQENNGSLYDFNKVDSSPEEPEKPGDPKPETPKPEEPGDPKPEIPKPVKPEKQKKITLDKLTDVETNEELVIGKHQTTLILPEKLPKGTKLKVTEKKLKSNEQKVKQAGDIFDFDFEFPNGKEFTGTFELKMAVNEDADIEKTGIYYFNEETQLWDYVGGKGMAKDGYITIEVKHFSTYGVLEATDDIEVENTIVESKKEEENNNENQQLDSQKNIDEDASSKLPDTATNSFNIILIGSVLLILGGIVLFARKQRVIKND